MPDQSIDEHRLSDRELLLLVADRQRQQHEQNSKSMERFETELKAVVGRVTELERRGAGQSGFFRGANWLWGLLTSAGVGTVAFLFGRGSGT